MLEVTVFDKNACGKDEFLGRCMLHLTTLKEEETHKIWLNLEEGQGSILLLVTISGTLGSDAISDLTSYTDDPEENQKLQERYVSFFDTNIYFMLKLMMAHHSGSASR